MLIRRNWVRHANWIAFLVVASLVAIGCYGFAASRSIGLPGGGSRIGLVYGAVAGILIVFEMLFWPRKAKRIRAWRIGSAQAWLRAHVWLGLTCVPFAVLHTGFKLGGELTTGLMILFVVVIAGGVYGLIVQNVVPKILLDEVPSETIHSQIEHVARRLACDAEDMVLAVCGPDPLNRSRDHFGKRERVDDGAVVTKTRRVGGLRGIAMETRRISGRLEDGRMLRDAFYDFVVDYLLHGRRSSSKLVDVTYASRFFSDLSASAEPAAADTIESLEDMCRQRRQFDKQKKWFFLLHSWLWLHLPLSVALFIALIAHVVVALKYL